jgi:hypothetical protein
MSQYRTHTVEQTELVYSILRNDYPNRQIEIEFNDNTKEYTLTLTKQEYKQDPEVPVDIQIKIVYGDSVVGDTPLLLKRDNVIYIDTIENIFVQSKRVEYPGFKLFDKSVRLEKEYCPSDYQIWTDIGWVDINKVIRHKCNKKIYRVTTPSGMIDVSEDHSLINSKLQCVKPNELKLGERLLHSFPVFFDEISLERNLTEKQAQAWGFFMKYGSIHDNIWSIKHTRLDDLIYYRELFQSFEMTPFEIKFGERNFVLTVQEQHQKSIIVEKYRKLFYNNDAKTVPNCILNAKVSIKQAFVSGVLFLCDSIDFFSSEKLMAQSMYYLLYSLGHNVEIKFNESKDSIRLTICGIIENPENVNCLIPLHSDTEQFIYDIETEIGRFGAGIGQLQTYNTDSVFLSLKYNREDFEKNRSDTFRISTVCGEKLTNEIFNRPPIEMEFEKVFQPFILLTKKRYIGKKFDNTKDPFKLKCIDTKGIALTRRDYCKFVKRCYQDIIDVIVDTNNLHRSVDVFKEYVDKIYNYQIDFEELIISAMLAKEYSCGLCKKRTEWSCIKCEHCKHSNSHLNEFCEKCKHQFQCRHTFSLAHVNLGVNLLKRKEEIGVNDRIQYLFVEGTDPRQKKGELAEEPKYAKEHNLKLNRVCYLEQLGKTILGFFKITLEHEQDLLLSAIDYINERLSWCGGKCLKPGDFKVEDQ